MVQNKRWVYVNIPQGQPKPGQDIKVESQEFDENQSPPEGGLIVKVLYASLDPYLRGRMRPESVKSYSPPLQTGSVIGNSTVSRVLKSNSSKAKEGDLIVAGTEIAEYAVVPKSATESFLFYVIPKERDDKIKLSYYVGVLGMPGLTAWSSFYEAGKPKKGETLWVTAASGPVGSIVGQLGRHEGLKVIGSVGNDEKLKYITEELGFHGGFDYHKEKPADAIKRLATDGVDIYYDNVGGEHLEAAIDAANIFARFVECGQISEYSTPLAERYPIRNLMSIVAKRLRIQGILVGDADMGPKYKDELREKLPGWIVDGSFKVLEDITDGIDGISEAFVGMLNGKNHGKAVVKVSSE